MFWFYSQHWSRYWGDDIYLGTRRDRSYTQNAPQINKFSVHKKNQGKFVTRDKMLFVLEFIKRN